MSTVGELAKQALREINLKALNTDLTPDELAEAILLMNRFIESLFGFELGEYVSDWPVPPVTVSPVPARFPVLPQSENLPDDVWPYPPGNVRLLLTLTTDLTVYLPQRPDNGAVVEIANVGGSGSETLTINGNGRKVVGGSTYVGTATELDLKRLFYRADLGEWVLVTVLTETDTPFLPYVYDDLIAIGTAIRIAGRYGRSLSEESKSTYKRLMRRMKTQYKQSAPSPTTLRGAFSYPQASSNNGLYGGGDGSLF